MQVRRKGCPIPRGFQLQMKQEEAATDVKTVQVSLVTNGVTLVRAVDVPVLVMMYQSALDVVDFIGPVLIHRPPSPQAKLRSNCKKITPYLLYRYQLPHPKIKQYNLLHFL